MANLKVSSENKKPAPERKSFQKITPANEKQYHAVCNRYEKFLTQSRTPFEVVSSVLKAAHDHQIKPWTPKTKASDKAFSYVNSDGSNAAIVRFGSEPIQNGLHIIAAHIDSPCLTAKVNPVREKPEGVALDCYPYGGIYMHQWFDTAVRVVGRCVKGGKVIHFELPGIINDATIHVSGVDRTQKKYDDAFDAESLDVFVGFKNKETFLEHMKKEYGIEDSDFARAMLIVVPNTVPHKISDLYFTGFGQDDKVCSFAQLDAILHVKPKKTSIVLFFDREEIGSTGYNGAISKFLEHVIDAAVAAAGEQFSDAQMRALYAKSLMISADVDMAFNSNDVPYSQEDSATKFGDGIAVVRSNGGRNQSAGNNVPLHIIDMYMELFSKHNIAFKVAAMPPKVNVGGGGTIAMYFAHRGLPVVDMGIPVINMHGKNPVVYLPDLFQMVEGFKVFLECDH